MTPNSAVILVVVRPPAGLESAEIERLRADATDVLQAAGSPPVWLAPRETEDRLRLAVVDVEAGRAGGAAARVQARLTRAAIHPDDAGVFGYEPLFAGGQPERPAEARAMLVAQTRVRPEYEAEFNDWYNREHVPGLLTIAGCFRARRFRDASRPGHYLALYDIAHPNTLAVETHWALLRTPWARRVMPRFNSERVRYCWAI